MTEHGYTEKELREIYLQMPNEDENDEWYGEVTWCTEPIQKGDIRYIRYDVLLNALVVMYKEHPYVIAELCDLYLDKSGELLGKIRDKAINE